MHFSRILILLYALWSLTYLATAENQELELLHKSINALWRGLQFMEDQMTEINLDGAFGCRLVGEFIQSFLESSPGVVDHVGSDLRDDLRVMAAKATRIADSAIPFIKTKDPQYYAVVGGLLEKSKTLLWYESRVTKSDLQVPPVPCSESVFNETRSDQCQQELIGRRSDGSDSCRLSSTCLDMMTRPGQRGYMITHQVLYFELLEMHNCLKKSEIKSIPESLRDILCSNVMRDAEEIATSGYPLNHRDLFMEQIGLCGIWGYKDFYKGEWLTNILEWQQKSGCYANRERWHCTENLADSKHRVKREEKILEDGCLSHKTTVALLALVINIRFNLESISETL